MTLPLLDDGHAATTERLREYEVDYTPGPVVRQGLEWLVLRLRMVLEFPRWRVLDPSAGAGVFGQQLHAMGHDPDHGFRWAVEPRFEEKGNLKRHYHEVDCCTFEDFADDGGRDVEPFDLVAGNPPFTLWPKFVERAYALAPGGAILLYGSPVWGQSAEGAEVFRRFPPYACARVVGRVHHRGPGLNPKTGKPWGADQRDSCWWLWVPALRPWTWTTANLPALPAEARRWTVRPGTEE